MGTEKVTDLLGDHFGHQSFRPGQGRVIDSLLAGRSALAIFPTGGGKSLCYQLPALVFDGLTVVVSPLLALMKDQVETLTAKGIAAARIDSTLKLAEVDRIYEDMVSGRLKLLYVAPERFGNAGFLRRLQQVKLSLLAIDEAHCISEWGHNFRPDYLKLAAIARETGVERVLALTATATPQVAEDIRRQFAILEDDVVKTSFYRENLEFLVDPTPEVERVEKLIEKIRSRPPGSAVVYVTRQQTAEEIAGALGQAGLDARAYHAGMNAEHRSELQDQFMAGEVAIVVATIAFGMGIDKPDIRFIYHFNLPKSLENYVQESGRAGRDGLPATCEILASREDLIVLENFIYGDTPSPTALKSLVEHMLMQGKEFSISRYQLSQSRDIRPVVLATALTYLEMEGVIEATGTFYAEYQYRFTAPLHRVTAGMPEEEVALLTRIMEHSKKGRIWHTADIEYVAVAVQEREEDVRKLLNELADGGELVLKPSGLRHAYRAIRDSPGAVSRLTKRLTSLFENREAGEVERLARVVEFCESSECLASEILVYFGDDPIACGKCSVCTGLNRGRALPESEIPEITHAQLERIEAIQKEQHRALRQPRQLARFLCGLTSPATTSSRLNRSDDFGMLEGIPFRDVLLFCEELV